MCLNIYFCSLSLSILIVLFFTVRQRLCGGEADSVEVGNGTDASRGRLHDAFAPLRVLPSGPTAVFFCLIFVGGEERRCEGRG